MNNNFLLPPMAIEKIIEEIAAYGELDVETGGFLLAPLDSRVVSVVALSGNKGIHREPLLFRISGPAMSVLFDWSIKNKYRILAQFHSHKNGAFMSYTDEKEGLCVDEFISTIAPNYKNPPTDLNEWGWWKFKSRWQKVAPPNVIFDQHASLKVVMFDELGIA